MLICNNCEKNWEDVGISWRRKYSNKIDYRCRNCNSKRKPIEKIKREFREEGKYFIFKNNDIPKKKKQVRSNKEYRKHLVIPDCQIRPDSPTDFLSWIGTYISEKKPDVIVNLGDFADMESLNYYDKGKTSFEGRRYVKDINTSKRAMGILTSPFIHMKDYNPEMHLVLGNHENRITRVVEDDQRLEGTLSVDNLEYESFGWEVHPFLEVIELDGVHYSHYFCNQLSGKPIGGESVLLRLKTIGFSFVMGHQQVYLVGVRSLNNGRRIRGIVQGACYLNDELYRGPQSNNEWRGIFVLHEVKDGDYSLMEISLDYLCRRYEGIPVWKFMKDKYPDIFNKSTWMQQQMRQE